VTDQKKTTTGTVYALIDPRDNRARYIGATTQTLKGRLQGHLASPVAVVKAWVDALAAEDLRPRIEAINEGVPESQLRDLEREEITRRLVAGERLLNQSATAQGRRFIERRREQERVEWERAAWECVANQVRSVLGGPLAPGDVAPISLGSEAAAAYQSWLRAEENAESEPAPNHLERLMGDSRLHQARANAADALWQSVRPIWGRLRGRADRQFDDVLAGRAGAVLNGPWADLQDASRYLALLPWGIVAVGPWAALAEQAGMDTAGSAFIDWVSDDATVREALRVLLVRSGGRMGPLSALDNIDNFSRPSIGLVAMTAAHHPGFDLPPVLNMYVARFLESMLRDGQLTPAMGDLLCKLEPRALDRILGPNVAADIDAQLGLPPGTSGDVLTAVLEKSTERRLDRLDRIVSRAKGRFPTVGAPDFRHFRGDTVPMFQTIVASLMASGILPVPSGKTPTWLVGEVRALWCGNPCGLERTA
jgi:hypothetical protein